MTLGITVVILLAVIFQALSFTGIGIASETGTGGEPLYITDISTIPQAVVDDALTLANELYGDSLEQRDHYVNQLLAMYNRVNDDDVLVLFNSGGWGWTLVEDSVDWETIADGMQKELDDIGCSAVVLSYQRTAGSLQGYCNELWEMLSGYRTKARDLSTRVQFLTEHKEDFSVVLAGESNGSIICDYVMAALPENTNVYCIQTGPPPWHKEQFGERTLVLKDNGEVPDSFAQADLWTIFKANVSFAWNLITGEASLSDPGGNIGIFVQAPGHEYHWEDSGVCQNITGFLQENFGDK